MNIVPYFFAALDQSQADFMASWAKMNDDLRNQLIMLFLFAVVIIGSLIWAAFYRKAKRRRVRIRRPHTWQTSSEGEPTSRRRHRRERRRRSEHPRRPANPTLAETGGLPPRRPSDEPPAGA